MNSNKPLPIVAVVPAAGVGSRFGSSLPKQYLTIDNTSILQITLNKLLQMPEVDHVVVAIGEKDSWFEQAVASHPKLLSVYGGDTRAQSVLNALASTNKKYQNYWALVHDAARPCVQVNKIQLLINTVQTAKNGGILAVPAADTVKNVNAGAINATLDRNQIWLAHTPQMFDGVMLYQCLQKALAEGFAVTDEASAMEQQGCKPIVVEDSRDNIKITHPEDLPLAQWILKKQQENAL